MMSLMNSHMSNLVPFCFASGVFCTKAVMTSHPWPSLNFQFGSSKHCEGESDGNALGVNDG